MCHHTGCHIAKWTDLELTFDEIFEASEEHLRINQNDRRGTVRDQRSYTKTVNEQ